MASGYPIAQDRSVWSQNLETIQIYGIKVSTVPADQEPVVSTDEYSRRKIKVSIIKRIESLKEEKFLPITGIKKIFTEDIEMCLDNWRDFVLAFYFC